MNEIAVVVTGVWNVPKQIRYSNIFCCRESVMNV